MKMTIREALLSEEVSFDDFYNGIENTELGYWDNINSTDIIYDYINEKMREGIIVSHILNALENDSSEHDLWDIWLGNSMETPKPINDKEDLVDALCLDDDDLALVCQF